MYMSLQNSRAPLIKTDISTQGKFRERESMGGYLRLLDLLVVASTDLWPRLETEFHRPETNDSPLNIIPQSIEQRTSHQIKQSVSQSINHLNFFHTI